MVHYFHTTNLICKLNPHSRTLVNKPFVATQIQQNKREQKYNFSFWGTHFDIPIYLIRVYTPCLGNISTQSFVVMEKTCDVGRHYTHPLSLCEFCVGIQYYRRNDRFQFASKQNFNIYEIKV